MKPEIKRIHCAWCDDSLTKQEVDSGQELVCDWCVTLPRYRREDRVEYEVDPNEDSGSQVF